MSKVGGREVVGTGVIVTHHGDIEIDLAYENLTYRLIFKEVGQESAGISAEVFGDRLEITLKNFNQPLGTAWFGDIGNVSGRKLYLSLMVHALGEGETITRSISYTFTLGMA